jgi:hypothetical protein
MRVAVPHLGTGGKTYRDSGRCAMVSRYQEGDVAVAQADRVVLERFRQALDEAYGDRLERVVVGRRHMNETTVLIVRD